MPWPWPARPDWSQPGSSKRKALEKEDVIAFLHAAEASPKGSVSLTRRGAAGRASRR